MSLSTLHPVLFYHEELRYARLWGRFLWNESGNSLTKMLFLDMINCAFCCKGDAMKMRILALLILSLAIWGWPSCGGLWAAEKKTAEALLLEAFKAEKAGGDAARVREKFQAVLQADPENYYALVKLGAMKMAEQTEGPDLSTINYLLRAAVAMPNNPEAFLYLAQLHYRMGYITEGDSYLRMCDGLNRNLVYDSICLLGWRYQDTGNYFAAIMTYAPAALSPDSKFTGDPFLVKRLYEIALMSQKPYDWVYEVTRLLYRETGQQIIDLVNNNVAEAFIKNPRLGAFNTQKDAAGMILRDLIISELKPYVVLMERVPENYQLPSLLYKFLFCNPEALGRPPFGDPYEAFVAASPGTPREKEQLLTALLSIKDQALKEVATAKNDEEKAKRLYLWLKKNVLKEYSALEGYSAKSILEKHKYDAVSGTILYVLLARDAKLDVKAFFVPGRVFAVADRERPIRIDLAAEGDEGFDVKGDVLEKFQDRDPSLDGTGFEPFGEIADPMQLVASLFVDAAVKRVDSLVLDKYEHLFRRVLKGESGLGEAALTEVVDRLRQRATARVASPEGTINISLESRQFRRLVRQMAVLDIGFRQSLLGTYEQGVALLKEARQLAPFEARFRLIMDDLIASAAEAEYDAANSRMVNRAARRAKAVMATTEADLPTMLTAAAAPRGPESFTGSQSAALAEEDARITEDARQDWPSESQAWIAAASRTATAVKQHPCDDRLRRVLGAIYARGMVMAQRRQDGGTIAELNRIVGALLQ